MGGRESTPIVTYETVVAEFGNDKLGDLLLRYQLLSDQQTGLIPKHKILKLFQRQLPLLDEFLRNRLFMVFNVSGNDKMSYQEFITMLYVFESYEENYRLITIFRILDLDGDGILSKIDFKKTFIRILSANQPLEWTMHQGNSTSIILYKNTICLIVKYSIEDFEPLVNIMVESYFAIIENRSRSQKVDVNEWIASRCSSIEVSRIIDSMKRFDISKQ